MFCVGLFYLHVCTCTMYISGTHRGQKRVVDSLKLKLQTVVTCHVGAWTCTWVIFKSSQCGQVLNCLQGTPFFIILI